MLRSIAFIWVSLALFIAVVYIILSVFALRSFTELERESATRNADRVLRVIDQRIMTINSKASDWAEWDDAYEFMQNGNSRFIQSNFALSAFTGLNLNLIAYIHNSGTIAYARWYYPGADQMVPLPDEVRHTIYRGGRLTSHRNTVDSVSGIIMLEEGPMLIASRPVLTSQQQGPPRGSLIFGQMLDSDEVQSLSRIVRLPVVIRRLDDTKLPADFKRAQTGIQKSGQTFAKPINKRVIAGYAILDDIYGKPALIIRVDIPRTFYNRGLALSIYTLAALVFLSVIFGSVVSLLLVHTVQKEKEYNLKTHEFYRRTIKAATDGKFIITNRSEIDELCGISIAQWDIRIPTDLHKVRDEVIQVAISSGFSEDRAWNLATGIGEAVTNAIKHAGGGKACLCRTPEGLLFIVSDQGPGIPALSLPDVALRRGYSTAGTLGMGYKMMISLVDRVHLATDPNGTTVAIEMKLQPEGSSIEDTIYT